MNCVIQLFPSQAEVRPMPCRILSCFAETKGSGGARDSGHGAGWPQAIESHGPNEFGLPLGLSKQWKAQEEGEAEGNAGYEVSAFTC